jgi:hypothetical protein
MIHFSRCIALVIVCGALLSSVDAQTTTVIPANEAAAHIGEYATVKGVVAKVFTSNKGKHIPKYRSFLSEPDIYRLDPAKGQTKRAGRPPLNGRPSGMNIIAVLGQRVY